VKCIRIKIERKEIHRTTQTERVQLSTRRHPEEREKLARNWKGNFVG
jgi:hypothetical protein